MMTRNERASEAIQAMVRRIVERFAPERVILFGSHARGEAELDSDVDLLVVARVTGSRRERANEIDLALADRVLPLDLIVATPEDVERDRHRIGTIVRTALREGQVLYERAA